MSIRWARFSIILLTGRPPFQAESLTTLLRQVVETEPVAPRVLNPGIPRDLETICLKCLEKEIPKRYLTALVLTEELGRFLDNRSIEARPVGPAGKAWRWCWRNPQLTTAIGVAALTLVTGIAGIMWQWQRAEAGKRLSQRMAYNADMALAGQAFAGGDLGRTRNFLDRHREVDLRDWEWRFLWAQCQPQVTFKLGDFPKSISCVAFTADSQRLFVAQPWGGHKLAVEHLKSPQASGVALSDLWPGCSFGTWNSSG